jgi:predicted MFS family arabinose efflux permease
MTDFSTTATPADLASRASPALPVAALLALAMTGFIAILTETLPAGLLPQIAQGLGVSEVLAGQLVTLYALGSLLAAIPLVAATSSWRRRTVLLVAIGGFLVFNTITTLSSDYLLTLASRFGAGVAAGLAWGLLAGYARRMVPVAQQGRALALAMIGTPLALSLGVPAGTLLGSLVGWRSAFGIMSGIALLLALWVWRYMPDFEGQAAGKRMSVRQVFLTPGVRPVLFVIMAWMLAHNILYTYITPFLAPSGLAARVDLVLLVFGLCALLGIWITGMLVDRSLRLLVLASLGTFALSTVALGVGMASPLVIFLAVAAWGLSFGGAATQLQTASADAAGEGMDVAQAMVTTSWNLAIAGGGLVGGVLLDARGAASFPWVMLGLLLLAGGVAGWAKRHGFKPGARAAGPMTVGH